MTGSRALLAVTLGPLAAGALALGLGGATPADAGGPGRAVVGSHGAGHHASAADAVAPAGATARAGLVEPIRGAVNPIRGGAARATAALRAAGTRSNPGRLLVTATEFRLALSRPTVGHGVVVVELLVAGEDPHDLALQRLDRRGRPTGRVLRIPRTGPGAVGDGEFRLATGSWRLGCTIPGHARMGMKATLRVR